MVRVRKDGPLWSVSCGDERVYYTSFEEAIRWARYFPRTYHYRCRGCSASLATNTPPDRLLTWTCGYCDTHHAR